MEPVAITVLVRLQPRAEDKEPEGIGTPVMGAAMRVIAERAAKDLGLEGPIDVLSIEPI